MTVLLDAYKGDKTSFLIKQLKKSFHTQIVYQNEPQNPQDTSDILREALDLFLTEIGEISN